MATEYERYTEACTSPAVVYGTKFAGMQFTVGNTGDNVAHTLESITIKWVKDGSPGDATIELKAVDVNGYPTGDVLYSVTVAEADIPSSVTTENIAFTSGSASLSASTMYAFYMKCPTGNTINRVCVYFDNDIGTYSGGDRIASTDSGSTWNTGAVDDLYFRLFGDPVTLVPAKQSRSSITKPYVRVNKIRSVI